jgi:acetyltransferase
VRSDHQQHGLGGALMHRLIDYARQRGYRRLGGSVERRNRRMLVLARELGFALAADVDDVALERVSLMLR